MKAGLITDTYLEDYNGIFPIQMPLVLFVDAAEHVARVVRILCSPGGNALLLGVGGPLRLSTFWGF